MNRFFEPPGKQPYWVVNRFWGTPLILGLGDKLQFEGVGLSKAQLTIIHDSKEKTEPSFIPLDYVAEQLCTTHKGIDLVFRFNGNGALMFDQDHEDNGAPSNGGSTGTGNVDIEREDDD